MNLKEYAEEKGISLAEAKDLTGLTHWKQEVVEVANIEPKQEIEQPTPVIETESKEVPTVSIEDIALSIKIHGQGSPCWKWRNLIHGN